MTEKETGISLNILNLFFYLNHHNIGEKCNCIPRSVGRNEGEEHPEAVENITLDKQDNSQTEVSNRDKRPQQKKLLKWR